MVGSKKEREGEREREREREGDDDDDDNVLLHEQASLCFSCLPV